MKAITTILKQVGERIEGNLICDISPDNWVYHYNIEKIRNLQQLCKGRRKIMEIGVNACHSLVIMLLENPTAEYLLFDLNHHKYTEPCVNYVKQAFPDARINIVYGDSVQTIDKYIRENSSEHHTYDLIHLDGGHTENIFSHDYDNSRILLNRSGIVIFDDYNYGEIKSFIDKKVSINDIEEYNDSNIRRTPLHFIYMYIVQY